MSETLRALAAVQPDPQSAGDDDDRATKIAECDRKLRRARFGSESGHGRGMVAETEAEKTTYALVMRDQKRARAE
jgi:hypothetical protein